MMAAQQTKTRGVMIENEPMSRHTSWRVGGPADFFYKPADLEDLVFFLGQLPEKESVFFLGLGSNLLVRDAGIRGITVCTSGVLNNLEVLADQRIRAEAGVSCAKASRFCVQHGIANAEFLAGIPGTIGGALAMNAGAFGNETWSLVDEVETVDSHGECFVRTPEEFSIAYRKVKGPEGEWFVAARLKQPSLNDNSEKGKKQIKKLLSRRNSTQPTQQPSAGSVFKNPEGAFSAELIENANLKGKCIGGACVSDKHANFIINMGNATALDIESLIKYVKDTVNQVHGVSLIEEVQIVGEPKSEGLNK